MMMTRVTQLMNKNVHLLQTLISITNRARKSPLKENDVPGIFRYVPKKKVRQAITVMQVHQSRLPSHDSVVSSALASTASGGS